MKLFDSHFHIIDKNFPLVANHGFLPDDFTVEQYLQQATPLNICAGAVVSGSFQAFDQRYLISALSQLGTGFVGVTQLPATVGDNEIIALHDKGVRALRFNFKRGGSASVHDLESLALRVHALVDWHIELYIDSSELENLFPILVRLPKISIDHLGLSTTGLPTLLKLIDKGARVKASGFGRVDFDIATVMQQIVSANPDALMFGTDLPCTRAPRPFQIQDIELIQTNFSTAIQEKIFYTNAANFYHIL